MKTSETLALEYGLNDVHATELYSLISDLSSKGFTHSGSLSNYIKENRLGDDYPNISGIVKMKRDEDTWDFEGGFPSNIYRIVCIELNLQNKKSGAISTGFTSYKNLNKNKITVSDLKFKSKDKLTVSDLKFKSETKTN